LAGLFDIKVWEERMMQLGILGLGIMGEAIVGAILKAGFDRKGLIVFEVKKERAQAVAKKYGLKIATSARSLAQEARYILIAVKPQDARELLPAIAPAIDTEKILVSIMAGTTW
jgi:pyrroline-5-carboxylate reductase